MSESNIDTGGFKRTLKDLFSGAAGGVAQVLIGQLNPSPHNSLSKSRFSSISNSLDIYWRLKRHYLCFLLCFT